MGWGGGSRITGDVILELRKRKISEEQRKLFYEVLIPALEDHDWDNAGEMLGDDPMLDEVIRELHPRWFEEEDFTFDSE